MGSFSDLRWLLNDAEAIKLHVALGNAALIYAVNAQQLLLQVLRMAVGAWLGLG